LLLGLRLPIPFSLAQECQRAAGAALPQPVTGTIQSSANSIASALSASSGYGKASSFATGRSNANSQNQIQRRDPMEMAEAQKFPLA